MQTRIVAEDVMTENPRSIRQDDSVGQAVEVLQSLEFRHLPVVNEQNELVGMLSDRDLRSLEVPYVQDRETIGTMLLRANVPVSAIMSSAPISIAPDTELPEIIETLLENKVGALPVVDAEGGLAGIVSYVDVLRTVAETTK